MALLKDTAHRIDKEPVLFLGCSGTEIFSLAFLGAIVGVLLGIIIGFISGWWFLILPAIFMGAFAGVYKGGKILMHKKEGKPEGYYGKLILSFSQIINLMVDKTCPTVSFI